VYNHIKKYNMEFFRIIDKQTTEAQLQTKINPKSVEEFTESMMFLESVEIDGFHYGIREQDIVKAFENHNLVYLTLNPEGTEKMKKMYGERVMRFFIYADRDTVIRRQKARKDNEEDIERHMIHYDETMSYKNKCEHTFENYDAPQVSFQISEVIESFLERNFIVTDY